MYHGGSMSRTGAAARTRTSVVLVAAMTLRQADCTMNSFTPTPQDEQDVSAMIAAFRREVNKEHFLRTQLSLVQLLLRAPGNARAAAKRRWELSRLFDAALDPNHGILTERDNRSRLAGQVQKLRGHLELMA